MLRFQFYLKQAEAMYLLDADLNRVTIEVLGDLLDDQRDRTVQVLLNWWKPEERTVNLHEGAKSDALIAALFSSVERGERCFVCSNSKTFINQIETKLIERVEPRKVLKVTSDNSQNPEIQAIMRDIKTRALDYAVILSSPAIGTGIDITFEDDAPLIDAVYGFFEPRINTHFDIDQQLSRVRNPGQVHVWISSEEYRFETDVLAIRAELLASGQKQRELLSISPDGKPVYDDLYDKIYGTVTASERASKNRLRKNFIDLRRSNGWNVEVIETNGEARKVGKAIRKEGKEALLNKRLQSILAAPQISEQQFGNLRSRESADKLNDNDRPAMRRYEIESFYCEDATLELLVLDDDGRLRESIRTFGLLVSDDETLKSEDRWDREILLPDQKQLLQKKHLLLELFKSAGILRDKAFDPAIEIDSAQLEAFARTAQKNKAEIERHFKIPVRGDVYKKPITQLQSILKLVGLRLPKSRTEQSGGKKRYFYRLAADELATVSTWASRRSDPHRRQAWRKQRDALINAGDPGSRVVD
ncbi:plasmid replication protein, CyRepA1 family [Variovorax sp. UC122_21]|uniref:plasmid replication protein, CyRepA1 family n=1 Tax=Variovorax sp. UC122_21 TaxID=3374554 RepID=UPI003757A3A5